MGKRNTNTTNTNSSNVLSQQRILNELTQMTQNDVKGQFNNNKKNTKKNQRQQKQQAQPQPQPQPQQQQPQQQTQQKQPQPQQKQQQAQKQKQKQQKQSPPQPQQPAKPVKPDTSVKNTSNLFSSWDYYTNFEWKNNPKSYVKEITQFSERGNLKAQVEKIQEIQVKYTYKPDGNQRKPKDEIKKMNKRKLKAAAARLPADMHAYRMKQLLQEINSHRQQRATHERVTNLLVKRYTNRMNVFAQEYQKAYKTYQESIKENLCVEQIKNSKINAHKMSNQQRRQQKKEKLQKKQFRMQRKRVLESHISPSQYSPSQQKLFQIATQMILGHGYDGFHYFRRPEYNRSLAWVDANENSTTKESISVASIMASQNSPIPEERDPSRLASYRVPTIAPAQQKSGGDDDNKELSKKPQKQAPKQKPMTIKTQTPEQYRQRMSGGKKQKQFKNARQPSEEQGNNERSKNKSSGSPRSATEQKPVSPSVVNPGRATWVEEIEYPDNFAWGILQHQPYNGQGGQGGQGGRNNKRGSKKQSKDETLNLLFPTSAPNTNNGGGNRQRSSNNNGGSKKQQNRKPQGVNISEML